MAIKTFEMQSFFLDESRCRDVWCTHVQLKTNEKQKLKILKIIFSTITTHIYILYFIPSKVHDRYVLLLKCPIYMNVFLNKIFKK